MGVLERYIFRQAFQTFLLALVTLITLAWLTNALRRMRLLVSDGQSVALFFEITTMAIPTLYVIIAPVALSIGVAYTLNRLNADSELVVATASGAGRWIIIKPLLTLAVLVSISVGILAVLVMPDALRHVRTILSEVRADVISTFLREGRFNKVGEMTFHIRETGPDGTLLGLLIHDARNRDEIMTYLAERGRVVEDNSGGVLLVMQDGYLQRRTGGPETVTLVAFDRYAFDMTALGNRFRNITYAPRERPTRDLIDPNKDESYYWRNQQQFRAELHERFSSALYPIAFTMIILSIAGFARTTRDQRGRAIVVTIVLIVGIRISGFAMFNLHRTDPAAIVGVYGIPLLTIAVASLAAFGWARGLSGRLRLPAPVRVVLDAGADRARALAVTTVRGRSDRAASSATPSALGRSQ
ncbi:MAG: LPS export ABC transporter permease LptF [Pseudomonadota bacterium]